MILVDTSVWVEHLRTGQPALRHLLDNAAVLSHPWVIGELALGQLSHRTEVLGLLGSLPAATVATAVETLRFIDGHQLFGTGISYVDAQLLAAARITPDARLWTSDKRLARAATRLDLAVDPRDLLGSA